MRSKLAVVALLAPFALAAPAFGLAGGSTGSGGGGGFSGGGGGGGGGSGGYYGGSGGSGSWDTASTIIFLLIMALVFGIPLITGSFNKSRRQWYRNRIIKRARDVDAAAGAANLDDGYWDPDDLRKRVREAFFPIQMSWEHRDVSASRPYVSDALYERHRLQLEGYEKQNRVNRIADLKLSTVLLVRLYNVTDDGQDRFVAYLECSARDWMEDTRTGQMINGNQASSTDFKQYWSFVRHPQYGWVLDEIQQGEEAEYHLKAPIVNEDEGPRIYEQGGRDGSPPAPATS
jgi:Tim44-like domain